jgi:hypothetical protein
MSLVSMWGTHVATVSENEIRVFKEEGGRSLCIPSLSPILAVCGLNDGTVCVVSSEGLRVFHGPFFHSSDFYPVEVGERALCEPTTNGGVLIATATQVICFHQGTLKTHDIGGVIALACFNKFYFVYATASKVVLQCDAQAWVHEFPLCAVYDVKILGSRIFVLLSNALVRFNLDGEDRKTVASNTHMVTMHPMLCAADSLLMVSATGYGTVWHTYDARETFYAGRAQCFATTRDAIWAANEHGPRRIPFIPVTKPDAIDFHPAK